MTTFGGGGIHSVLNHNSMESVIFSYFPFEGRVLVLILPVQVITFYFSFIVYFLNI